MDMTSAFSAPTCGTQALPSGDGLGYVFEPKLCSDHSNI